MAAPRTNFGVAPRGYISGAGRGAVGFTTRSDIGPARAAAPEIKGRPHPMKVLQMERDKGDYSDSKFDYFSGFSENLFSRGSYDNEDREADDVYEAIDRRMDSRRKQRRERLAREEDSLLNKIPKIHVQFSEDKRRLAELSADDWENIPEAGDLSRKRQKTSTSTRSEKFTPVPDSILQGSRGAAQQSTMIDVGGLETPAGTETPTNLTQLGTARGKVLDMTLGKLSDSVDGQTVVDPKGYLTDLKSMTVNSQTEVSDIRKARLLLTSVTKTNPKHPPGWLAAARLEEHAGKLSAARKLIMRACEVCQNSEDVWLEAARLHPPDQSRSILAKAVRHIPKSVKIWLYASRLEKENESQKAVLRRALEFIPNSVKLWKAAIAKEMNENDARIMLSRAVECVPTSVEMWMALANLESYDQAKRVLNLAREAVPTSVEIWVTAAKLQEAHGNEHAVEKIIGKAVSSLMDHKVVIEREDWLKEGAKCEASGSPLTCQAIVRATIGMGIEEQDRRNTWSQDAAQFLEKGSIETARAIYAHMLTVYPAKPKIWWEASQLEKKHGTYESLCNILQAATTYCRQSEAFWLMYAKEKWLHGDVDGSREILSEAFVAQSSEAVWLAAVKLESENNEIDRARMLLEKARGKCNTPRVWMKSALLERETVGSGRTVAVIKSAVRHVCVILDDDSIKCWGENTEGPLGLGDVSNRGDAANEMGDNLPAVDLGSKLSAGRLYLFHESGALMMSAVVLRALCVALRASQSDRLMALTQD
eukprot:986707_1